MKSLLVVESAAKAKTIAKYLGKNYDVVPSFGHIRDLPSKKGSVEPEKDFTMHYEIGDKSYKNVSAIIDKVKSCDRLILAPDPDREGESIAWHVLEVLKQKKAISSKTKVERVVFNSITKSSVTEAIKNPRDIDMDLVNAQQARRALDYLVGFTLSPVLWRKLPGSRSAGRVQSVALRIICDREDEIEAFKSEEYWDIKLDLNTAKNQNIVATLTRVNGEKLEKLSIKNQEAADRIVKDLRDKKYQVIDVVRKDYRRRPYPPFITSSLQQEAARKLGFSAKKTMQVAQKLYEGVDIGDGTQGLITYMRTDGVYMAPEAINDIRSFINSEYGSKYLPAKPIVYQNKVKNAQEAHEAIRPTDCSLAPKKIKKYLEDDFFKLYDLIWKRAFASQMSDVIMDQVLVTIKTDPDYAELKASGSVVKFDGFQVLYNEDEDEENKTDDDKKLLPDVKLQDKLSLLEIRPLQHFTEPLPRYSEASLVKRMEELGIGRPSTYASIISVLQDRSYVRLDKKRFIPEERGRVVVAFLKEFFSSYVEYDYTAKLEDDLDVISNGDLDWKKFLHQFWDGFDKTVNKVIDKTIPEVLESLNKNLASHLFGFDDKGQVNDKCPSCAKGKLGIKIGKFGVFVGCSSYPECNYTRKIDNAADSSLAPGQDESKQSQKFDPKLLGEDRNGNKIFLKKGPYGFYIELDQGLVVTKKVLNEKKPNKAGSGADKKKKLKPSSDLKPKRVAIPKLVAISDVNLEFAQKLLSLPREVGNHPETGLPITASIGPFGPYLLHNKKYARVKDDDVLEIGLNRAVDLIVEGEARSSNGKRKIARKFKKSSVL